ncbi:MAG: hypothetical protein WCS43_03390 [Verrucomicrobiota bacterium]
MKPSQYTLAAVTGILGLALGLALAPSLSNPGNEIVSESSTRNLKNNSSTDTGNTASTEGGKITTRTRTRDRGEDRKPKEQRVSIPLKTLVRVLKDGEFNSSSNFNRLYFSMEKALTLLGTTEGEREEITNLVKKSESEILAAEKNHLKLGEVTADLIRMDMSGMRGPAEEIARQTQDGMRTALPADLAEAIISAIKWEDFYPVDDKAFTRLEITRGRTGKLMVWEKSANGGMGHQADAEFKDDGTPLPADRIFPDRWKPFLKGVTILPKDEE